MRIRNRSEFPAAGSLLRENSRDFETGEHQTGRQRPGRFVQPADQSVHRIAAAAQEKRIVRLLLRRSRSQGAVRPRFSRAPAQDSSGDHGIPRRDCRGGCNAQHRKEQQKRE